MSLLGVCNYICGRDPKCPGQGLGSLYCFLSDTLRGKKGRNLNSSFIP